MTGPGFPLIQRGDDVVFPQPLRMVVGPMQLCCFVTRLWWRATAVSASVLLSNLNKVASGSGIRLSLSRGWRHQHAASAFRTVPAQPSSDILNYLLILRFFPLMLPGRLAIVWIIRRGS